MVLILGFVLVVKLLVKLILRSVAIDATQNDKAYYAKQHQDRTLKSIQNKVMSCLTATVDPFCTILVIFYGR
jgi:hypothetical protein